MRERRKYPRLEKSVPVKLEQPHDTECDISTAVQNISANGLFCSVSHPIELMTRLKISLLIPLHDSRRKDKKEILCEGVVVRMERDLENAEFPYRVGIFFNSIDSSDRKFLQSYVAFSLPKV